MSPHPHDPRSARHPRHPRHPRNPRNPSRPRASGIAPPWPLAAGLAALLAILVAWPVTILVVQSVAPRILEGRLDGLFDPWRRMATTEGLPELILGSLRWALAATALATLLGVPSGYLLARTDLRGRSLARMLVLVPLLTPPYVLAIAWILLMQPSGTGDALLGRLGPAGAAAMDLARPMFFSFWGIAFVMALAAFGYVALAVENALLAIPLRLELAAESLGAGRLRVLLRIVLPLLLPAIANAALLVFLDAISNFGIPAVLGPRTGVLLLPAEIYQLATSWPVDLPLATALSSLLLAMAVVALAVNRTLLRGRVAEGGRGPGGLGARRRLGALGQLAAWAWFALIALAGTLLPAAAILSTSVLGDWIDGQRTLTLAHWRALVTPGAGAATALWTSLWLGAVAASACVAIGAPIAWLSVRGAGRLAPILDALGTLPRVLPKLVVAVGLILAWNAPWVPVPVYGTAAILLVAYVALYLSDALRLGDAAMRQVPARLELAAATLGATRRRIAARIVLPLVAGGLIAAWATTFVACLRDLVASVMLLPPGMETAGSFIFSRFEQGELGEAMAMSAAVSAAGLVVLVAVQRLVGRR
ncbi:MAG TPA: iron ABC transporter permease [Phycisphaerales bacterium]|nr:iron ABC transporter permease [Phycisphaerales bacterium]